MKKLILTIILALITLIACGHALAYNDCMEEFRKSIRQADKDNYRNRMLAIQEELLYLERQKEIDRDIERMEHWNDE